MKEILQPIVVLSIFLATIYFICWIRRERFTFLNLTMDAKIVNQINQIALVSITITLENRGKTKIEARRREHLTGYLRTKYANFLYNDRWDQCEHAGTLKIREVPNDLKVDSFDWYSLKPITSKQCLKNGIQDQCDFEQINYLDEYEKPPVFNEVAFWIEPYETYHEQVMVFLPHGIYVIKAFFLGSKVEDPEEDEYWSYTKLIKIM
jgi:hypothetical protein